MFITKGSHNVSKNSNNKEYSTKNVYKQISRRIKRGPAHIINIPYIHVQAMSLLIPFYVTKKLL